MIRNLNPPGQCMYCGATRYSAERERLGDEHIIPEGIGGTLELPKASCLACEQAINTYEQPILRHHLGGLRYTLGIKSKHSGPRTVAMMFNIDGEWLTHRVSPETALGGASLPILDYPDLLRRIPINDVEPINIEFAGVMHGQAGFQELLKQQKNVRGTMLRGSFDVRQFRRFIAKMAFGYAYVHTRDQPDFQPLLLDIVLGRDGPYPPRYLVGGSPEIEPDTKTGFEVALSEQPSLLGAVLVVRIRLFSAMGMPTYYAVAGILPVAASTQSV